MAVDESAVGRELGTVTFPIDRSKLHELARSFGDDDPVWWSDEAAREAGFDAVPAPPTVTVLSAFWTEGGAIGAATALGLDVKRLLHGEAAWEYRRPVVLGDELTGVTRVAGVSTREGKRGGTMTLVTTETTFTDASGEVVAVRRDTMIETGA